ncbi:BRO family protein [Arcanobacterium canis]
MGNQIQTFTNDVFGTIRTIMGDGQTLFCGKDVAIALGYQDPMNAVKLHCKGVMKCSLKVGLDN